MTDARRTRRDGRHRGHGRGVRITNEGSSYTHNFSLTREVATATRHYGTFCGFEPAAAVDANGVIGRIYNATASGARQLHDYTPNTLGHDAAALGNFRTYAPLLVPRRPRIDAAFYLSRETWALAPQAIGPTYQLARVLRDAADLDFVTRRSVIDGHLRQYRAWCWPNRRCSNRGRREPSRLGCEAAGR